ASPAYLKLRGVPKRPTDLQAHDCITYERPYVMRDEWRFHSKGTIQTIKVPSRLVVNSAEAAVAFALADAGIARVLSYQLVEQLKSGALVQLLQSYDPPSWPVNLVYPSQRQVPLKLRAFLDFAAPRLRQQLGYKP